MHLGDTWGGGWNQHRSQCEHRGVHQRHVPMATPPIPPRRHQPPGCITAERIHLVSEEARGSQGSSQTATSPPDASRPKTRDAQPLSGRVRVGGRLLDSPQNKLHKHTHTATVAWKMVGLLSVSLQQVLISDSQMERTPAKPRDMFVDQKDCRCKEVPPD